ncbi:hypothetical protein JTB14_028049 [Gonioctena quinquepunctata]|nr:hypothetical protein JTB14_028049 [Gonioctena quinquepunctata]
MEILETIFDEALNETIIDMKAFRNRIESDASRLSDRSDSSKTRDGIYDTSDKESAGSEFVKPENRAKIAAKRYESRIQVLEVKEQRSRTPSTTEDDYSDSPIKQYKRKRVKSPIGDFLGEIKSCDCEGISINHKVATCIPKNEHNKYMKELNEFESGYTGETNPKRHPPLAPGKGTKILSENDNKKTTCECGGDASTVHFLYNKENTEHKTRCLGSIKPTESHYNAPLITKQQLEE